MRYLSAIWGIGGVLAILLFAVYRLAPIAEGALSGPLAWYHWIFLVVWVAFMIFTEGIRGFHQAFSPRVVARARALVTHPDLLAGLFAPFYCFGFFRATRKRRIVAWAVFGGILGLILFVRLLPQPWRGLVDAGVVAGLTIGAASILYYAGLWLLGRPGDHPPDLPEAAAPFDRAEP